MVIDLIHATAETFTDYVGDRFVIQTEVGTLTLTLDNVKMFDAKNMRDNHLEIEGVVYPPRQPFALTFEGPREPVLESQIYKLSHKSIEGLELFISGFRQDPDCMLYESCFN